MGGRLKVLDTEAVIRMYKKLGNSTTVATLIGTNPNRVRDILTENGIALSDTGKRKLKLMRYG